MVRDFPSWNDIINNNNVEIFKKPQRFFSIIFLSRRSGDNEVERIVINVEVDSTSFAGNQQDTADFKTKRNISNAFDIPSNASFFWCAYSISAMGAVFRAPSCRPEPREIINELVTASTLPVTSRQPTGRWRFIRRVAGNCAQRQPFYLSCYVKTLMVGQRRSEEDLRRVDGRTETNGR